jgi:hypothetical protein
MTKNCRFQENSVQENLREYDTYYQMDKGYKRQKHSGWKRNQLDMAYTQQTHWN